MKDTAGRTAQASRRYAIGYAPEVHLSGRSKVRHHTRHTWRVRAHDSNTGGRVATYTWRIGSRVYGHGTRLAHRFSGHGRHVLSVTVVNNSGVRTHRRITVRVV